MKLRRGVPLNQCASKTALGLVAEKQGDMGDRSAPARAAKPAYDRKAAVMVLREPASINDIRTAIRELSLRAELARKDGREHDAAELERRVQT